MKGEPEITTDYTLHFNAGDFELFFIDDIFMNPEGYGAVDYVVLFEHNTLYAYLSAEGTRQAAEIGADLLDGDFAREILERGKTIVDAMLAYQPPALSAETVDNEWKRYLEIAHEYSFVYRYCEEPFQKKLEAEIETVLSPDEFVTAVSSRNLDAIPDEKTRRLVQLVINLGDLKLKLHADAERYFLDNAFFAYTEQQTGMPIESLLAMRLDEFEKALHGEMTVSPERLRQRQNGCALVKEAGSWRFYEDADYGVWKDRVTSGHGTDVRGSVAFAGGVVRGRAVVHLAWAATIELEPGDILVSGMTSPQMIPFVKQAAGIVTDEGGIMCHAAIISRELKIPCIVGTQNATRMLQTGDMIELNTETGTVRVLSRS